MTRMRFLLAAAIWLCADLADAQIALTPAKVDEDARTQESLLLGAYVESFWQWNFNRPQNGLTNYRGFDNRHNSVTVSNVAVDLKWDWQNVLGRVALQVGHTGSTYYASEPTSPGSGGANGSSAELWKYVQQANGGYRFRAFELPLAVEAGIFLSPIGPESMVVHENWHWSRSNLFFGLPFYHTGARATLRVSGPWELALAAFNGWNSVVDNNGHKSLVLQARYAPSAALVAAVLYFAGVERPRGAPEGSSFRHMIDAHATAEVAPWLALMGELNGGYEPTLFGAARWAAAAGSLRFTLLRELALALRADLLREWVPADGRGRATPLFFPSAWVSSATATLAYQPADRVSFRLEYRHDHADSAIYFRGPVAVEGTTDARSQDTVTVGGTVWL